ncbi:uncharacterized protein LOC141525137 [Cotesia typhae]|uniref:uncharacterized protein LOC141525137 n=1 Tax=Cotesia typhae TaxID=2053667 RepID=UPI003D6869A6
MLNADEHEPDVKNPEPSVEFSWLWASSLQSSQLTQHLAIHNIQFTKYRIIDDPRHRAHVHSSTKKQREKLLGDLSIYLKNIFSFYLLLTIIEFGVSVNKDLMCGQKQLRCQRRRKRCENCRKSESMNSEEANDDDWTDNWLFIGLDY